MPKSQTKRLLVEGKKDKWLLPFLMEKNGVEWPKGNEPVDIEDLGRKLLTKPEASAYLKESGLRFLGVILDADDDAGASWRSVKGWFQEWFADMPDNIPAEGYISAPNEEGIRLGVWIMPDNQTHGMLETFLKLLVRDKDQELWTFAKVARDEAMATMHRSSQFTVTRHGCIRFLLGRMNLDRNSMRPSITPFSTLSRHILGHSLLGSADCLKSSGLLKTRTRYGAATVTESSTWPC